MSNYWNSPSDEIAFPTAQETILAPVNNPLSEDEMRAFFERMVTTIVGYSKQDGEIKALQGQVSDVNERLSRMSDYVVRLEATNQNLMSQNTNLQREIEAKAMTISELHTEKDMLYSENTSLTDKIVELGDKITSQNNLIADQTNRIDGFELDSSHREQEIERLNSQLKLVMEDRDNASKLYSETRDKLEEANRKLSGVEAAIRNVEAAFGHPTQNVVNF